MLLVDDGACPQEAPTCHSTRVGMRYVPRPEPCSHSFNLWMKSWDPDQVQHPVRRSGQLGQHVPYQVRSKVYEDCTANANAEIPRGTRDADKGIEGNHPDPREGRNLVEPPKEEHRRGHV